MRLPSPKKKGFSVAFAAQLELWGCARPCAEPSQVQQLPLGEMLQLLGQHRASNVPQPQDRGTTNMNWGVGVGQQYSAQLPFDAWGHCDGTP